jgi:hypothetical protein
VPGGGACHGVAQEFQFGAGGADVDVRQGRELDLRLQHLDPDLITELTLCVVKKSGRTRQHDRLGLGVDDEKLLLDAERKTVGGAQPHGPRRRICHLNRCDTTGARGTDVQIRPKSLARKIASADGCGARRIIAAALAHVGLRCED